MTIDVERGLTEAEVVEKLRQAVAECSLREWGEPRGITDAAISQILRGHRRMSAPVAMALGLRAEVRYFSARRR